MQRLVRLVINTYAMAQDPYPILTNYLDPDQNRALLFELRAQQRVLTNVSHDVAADQFRVSARNDGHELGAMMAELDKAIADREMGAAPPTGE